jgi:hypothetical protein
MTVELERVEEEDESMAFCREQEAEIALVLDDLKMLEVARDRQASADKTLNAAVKTLVHRSTSGS